MIYMIVNIFTTLQPIMHIVGLLYFIPRFLVAKTQVFFLHEVQHEGYGGMWPGVRNRMVVALLLYQFTMLVCLSLKLAAAQAAIIGVVVRRKLLLVPLPCG